MPTRETIHKKRKNDFYQSIVYYDFEPSDFSLEESNVLEMNVSTISIAFKPDSKFCFKVTSVDEQHEFRCCPGESDDLAEGTFENWGDVIISFDEWLKELKVEIETPRITTGGRPDIYQRIEKFLAR